MVMLRFCGFGLELFVDEVLDRRADHLAVCSATDFTGQRWLIAEGAQHDKTLTWWCAPASTKTLEMVSAGLATPSDAVCHSATGWVEVVSVVDGRCLPERRVRCSDLRTDASFPSLAHPSRGS